METGRRVECDGYRGTLRWIGELPPAEGTWYGVEWDDASRGRHDGSYKDTKYFETRHPTSGSFVRAAKVNLGITFEEALRGRYQDDTTIQCELTEQLSKEMNARFVEVVGMDKVGKKQSNLDYLGTAVLTGLMIQGTDDTDLRALLPRLYSVDVSNSLLSSWTAVADITRQLPSLRFLNLSGNMLSGPDDPEELKESLSHVVHLVLNSMLYSWTEILTCCAMFPELRNLQVAFNKLEVLGSIPCGQFTCLEELDIGENPIASWEEICHLGSLPRLETLNANSCCLERITFPATPTADKTPLFPHLKHLMLANNPLDTWECTGELNKLAELETLVMTYNVKTSKYCQEFTFARISNLKALNRTELSAMEKRDCELFYLKKFGSEYYESGGKEDEDPDNLSLNFTEKHPSYTRLIKAHGAPMDDTSFKTQKSQKLKDLKVELKVIIPSDPERQECFKSFLLTTRIAKVKMMLKRHMKITPSVSLNLSYHSIKNASFEIHLDNDQQDLAYYSIENGDTLVISW